MEDPYLMGKILTVLAVFYPLYGKTFVLTPVFDENRLEVSSPEGEGHAPRLICSLWAQDIT